MTPDPSTPDTSTSTSPVPSHTSSRAPFIALVVALAGTGGTAALWLAPRPALPAELPPLVVPAHDAESTLAQLGALGRSAPADDDETESRRHALYRAFGVAEVHPSGTPAEAHEREDALEQLAAEEATRGTLDAIRARDVERTVAALRERGGDDERLGEVGALPDLLVRYGAVIEGRRVAPPIVVHALAWARWNGVHRRELTEGMDDTMLRAYHGWLVYYGPAEGTDLRSGALVEYVRVGGLRGLETEGYLRLGRGDPGGAQLAFEAAYEATGNVRLRNHALALGLAELDREDPRPDPGS